MKIKLHHILLIFFYICCSLATANLVIEESSAPIIKTIHGRRLLQNDPHDRDQEFDQAVLGVDDANANPDVVAQQQQKRHHKPQDVDNNIQADTIKEEEFYWGTVELDSDQEIIQPPTKHDNNDNTNALNNIDNSIAHNNNNNNNNNKNPDLNEDAFARGVMAERQRWLKKWQNQHPDDNDNSDGENIDEEINIDDDNDPLHHRHYDSIPLYEVMIMTIAMATAAGLGAVPFFFVRTLSKRWSAIATAIACGVMFAASFDLIHEGQPYGGKLVILGIFLGGLFIRFMQNTLGDIEDVQFGNVRGNKARRLVLMIGIMAAHAVGEGCGVGVSFVGERGWTQGVLTTLAIGVHNIPEGLAKATVLVSQGATAQSALVWSILTCLPQPLVAIPSFLFVEGFKSLLPIALGFAAGCMIWMVFAELLPEALEDAQPAEVASAATLAAAGLEGIRMAFENLETASGTFMSPLHGSHYEHMGIAAIGGGMQIVAAAIAGTVVGGAPLPAPVALGFCSIAAATAAFFPLFRLIFDPQVPLLHTTSAVVAGAAAALLLRRQVLVHHPGGAHTTAMDSGGKSPKNKSTFHHKSSETSIESMEDAVGDGMNNGNAHHHHQRLTRRSDTSYYQPDSPSKAKGAVGWNQLLGSGGTNNAIASKELRGMAVPSMAMGTVVAAASLAQATALGWYFAVLLLSSRYAKDITIPSVLALAVRGLIAGGAARAAMGRSGRLGGLLGAVLGMVSASSMLTALSDADSVLSEAIRNLKYPYGWTDTLSAAACGAMAMAALMKVAVAMSLNGRHARFGVLMGVLLFGGVYVSLFAACNVVYMTGACTAMVVAF